MARPVRASENPLVRRLVANPHGFEFFQAVRLLEASKPSAPRVGVSVSPRGEAVRLGQVASLCFPPTDLADLLEDVEEKRHTLLVHAFGLLGPHGPLPNVVTNHVIGRLLKKDSALLDFVNLFNHRLLGFLYRTWAAANKAVDHDRACSPHKLHDQETCRQGPRFRAYLGCLAGRRADSEVTDDHVLEDALLYYSGRLSGPVANAEGLKDIVEGFFGVPANVEMFRPCWLPIPAASRWRLGDSPLTGRLGVNTVLGEKVLDRQATFRLILGPLDKSSYDRLLPPAFGAGPRAGLSFERLCTLVRRYTQDRFFWDVEYVLSGRELPPFELDRGRRLGFDTWLRGSPNSQDAEDYVVVPERVLNLSSPDSPQPSAVYAGN
ncbi:MAG: type VI secretion system baseplate subunit TssG [Verrucomicrobiales bacterium]|nr:type VI secretion system baseplate subunit TssG [Verrucomicrobiales bacterium]